MTARHCKSRIALPKLWLMTDERIGEAELRAAVARLPRGAGVVFRHYSLPRNQRRELFDRVRTMTQRRGVMLLLAGSARQARTWRADGWHGRERGSATSAMIHSAPAHNIPERLAAERAGADLLFLSPVFSTRSHPGGQVLGRVKFAFLARGAGKPVIALGGMTARRARSLNPAGIYGWAAIDALTGQPVESRKR